ncbi:hypothetical protein J7L48_09115 [bacterium]|nr:hypothetical protein [bacterium]
MIYYIITLVFIIMTLTRTLIAISFIFSVLFILRKSSNLKKILSVVVIIISIYFISQMSFVRIMMRETEKQTAHWENDIRVRSADYFLHHFSPTTVAKIFGNGQPYQNTHYDYFVGQILGKRYGYFTDDIGYIGIYVTFGILAIIALFLVFYRMVKIKLPDEYEYIRYFMYFIFITSIIIGVAISPDYIPSIVFAIYIMSSKDLSQSYHRKIL